MGGQPGRHAFATARVMVAIAAVMAAVVLIGGHGAPASGAPSFGGVQAGGEPISWLAAGDSFSSGEGIPRAMGDCQQSEQAFGPRAARLLETERGATVTPVLVTACTGAVSQDFFNRVNKTHPRQADWARNVALGGTTDGRYDVVTLSFGGNDIDFGGVMVDCLTASTWSSIVENGQNGCSTTPEEMAERIANLSRGVGMAKDSGPFGKDGQPADLASFYAQVADEHLAEGGVLVVAGYPRLIAPSDQWGKWRNGRCGQLSAADADMIGDAAEILDATTKAAARKAQTLVEGERTIAYVSRLDLFDADGVSRSLCTRNGASWINGVSSVTWNHRKESPYHPNEIGHLKTAERVAAAVWKVVKAKVAPVPESAPEPELEDQTEDQVGVEDPLTDTSNDVISDGSIGWGVGDRFSDLCSVAWPTAPVITATSIEVTTFCQHTPQQFLFVHVSYPDPDLPLNPMTGFSRVEGTIVGTSTNGVGVKQLVVEADTYILDAG